MEGLVFIIFIIIGCIIAALVLGVMGYFDAQRSSRRIDELHIRISRYREEISKLKAEIADTSSQVTQTEATPIEESSTISEPAELPVAATPPQESPIIQSPPAQPLETVAPLMSPSAAKQVSAPPEFMDKTAPTDEKGTHADPVPTKPPFPWRELLAQVHLLPPDGKSSEANLAAWWTTRIGIIFAIISAVFFAVHVSKGIPAWLKFAELLGASLLVTGLGHWLCRRPKMDLGNTNIDTIKYGQVIFGGGLALIFLSSFAAYAFEPVKIIHSPVVATLFQFVTATGIMITAWIRRRPLIACMSSLLGFIACWFGQAQGVDWFVMGAMALLSVSNCALFITRRWAGPAWISLAGSFGTFITLTTLVWSDGNSPSPLHAVLMLAIYWAIFMATDLLADIRKLWQPRHEGYRKCFISANSTLTVTCGYLYFRYFQPTDIHLFYFGAGALALAAAYLCYLPREKGYGFHNYFLKASSLIAIGLVYYLDGPAEWMSLLVQAAAMLWAARGSHSVWLESFFHIAIVIAWSIFLNDTTQINSHPGAWSMEGLWSIAFIISLTILLSLQAKVFAHKPAPWGECRAQINGVFGFVLGCTVLLHAIVMYDVIHHLLYYFTAAAVTLAVIGATMRHWIGILAGVLLFLAAQITYFVGGHEIPNTSPHLYLFLILAGLSISGYWLMAAGAKQRVLSISQKSFNWIQLISCILVVTPAFRALYSGCGSLETNWITLLPFAGFAGIIIVCGWLLSQVAQDSNSTEYQISARLTSLAFGVLLCVGGFRLFHEHGIIIVWSVAAALNGAYAFVIRNKLLLYTATPSLFSAFVYFCSGSFSHTIGGFEAYGLMLAALLITLLLAIIGIAIRFRDTSLAYALDAIGWIALFITIQVALFRDLSLEGASLWLLAGFILIYGTKLSRWFPSISDIQWILPAGMLATWLYRFAEADFRPVMEHSGWYLGFCVLSLVILALPHTVSFRLGAQFDALMIQLLQTTLWLSTTLVLIYALPFSELARIYILLSALLISSGINPWLKNVPLFIGQWGLACLISHHVIELPHAIGTHSINTLFLTASIACLCIIAAGLLSSPRKIFTQTWNFSAHYWISAILALTLFFITTSREAYMLSAWTTVFWGLGAICIFVSGFVFHCRPYRLIGLTGLAICIPRVFIVDIVEVFHRIIAFGVLAGVLLLIGFLYSKYKDRIDL
ncbi:MAG: DUF2339 domain-containing protein [Verrucomicrobiota bacterium]